MQNESSPHKIILASATPLIHDTEEIVELINLMHPISEQIRQEINEIRANKTHTAASDNMIVVNDFSWEITPQIISRAKRLS